MSCCVDPKTIIERLRKGDRLTDREFASLCVVSLCDKLRAELHPEDLKMVKNMLQSDNPYEACIGQVLVRPFLHQDGMKEFLINLWRNTKHEYLKAGLLFDLFEYEDLDKDLLEDAFRFLANKKEDVLAMLNEWLEGEERAISAIQQKLSKKDLTPHKRALYKQILKLYRSFVPKSHIIIRNEPKI